MSKRKSELQVQLDKAVKSGKFMVAVWTVEGETLNIYRKTEEYPVALFQQSVQMLQDDLANANLPPVK